MPELQAYKLASVMRKLCEIEWQMSPLETTYNLEHMELPVVIVL
jgi:hypothetical protein